ncbi:SAM-dependent methyltransferase [Streptomyces sp. MS2.AVA.5]|uniref:Class I SAM-dependent methyltransferase n=1 Tax=Streptomyces achmelvichensis TaxID=3134111 RepID=A0ACC6PPM6_9ACTN
MTTVPGRPVRRGHTAEHPPGAGDAFHRLLLGETMVSSGGYWEDGEDLAETLDEAQERKLDRFVELAGATGARRVLDLGCGWGTLLNRLTVVHGVEHAVGLTHSRIQERFVTGFGNPRISARVETWQDHVPDGPYDAAFGINTLEQVVPAGSARDERAARYRAFFTSLGAALRPGARLVLHILTAQVPRADGLRPVADLAFLRSAGSPFPAGHIPRLCEVVQGAGGSFDVLEIVDEHASYARACRAWLQRLARCRDVAVVLAGEDVVTRYERGLGILAYALEDRILCNVRITAARR